MPVPSTRLINTSHEHEWQYWKKRKKNDIFEL